MWIQHWEISNCTSLRSQTSKPPTTHSIRHNKRPLTQTRDPGTDNSPNPNLDFRKNMIYALKQKPRVEIHSSVSINQIILFRWFQYPYQMLRHPLLSPAPQFEAFECAFRWEEVLDLSQGFLQMLEAPQNPNLVPRQTSLPPLLQPFHCPFSNPLPMSVILPSIMVGLHCQRKIHGHNELKSKRLIPIWHKCIKISHFEPPFIFLNCSIPPSIVCFHPLTN